MLPRLSAEQRHAAFELGLPLPIYDAPTHAGYVLFPARLVPEPSGAFAASIPGLPGTGNGATPEEAMLALGVLVRGMSRQSMDPDSR